MNTSRHWLCRIWVSSARALLLEKDATKASKSKWQPCALRTFAQRSGARNIMCSRLVLKLPTFHTCPSLAIMHDERADQKGSASLHCRAHLIMLASSSAGLAPLLWAGGLPSASRSMKLG